MGTGLLTRAGGAALVSAAAAATFWLHLSDARIVVLGVPVLGLGALVAMDDPPGSRVRAAGVRVFSSMLVGGAAVGAVALMWPPEIEPRQAFALAAAMSGAFAAGLVSTIWQAARLARPVQTRRVTLAPRPLAAPRTVPLTAPFRAPDLPGRTIPLKQW
ncbi:MAG: hypothetical protein ACRDXD_09865 [Acidimicrobiia bacterium]